MKRYLSILAIIISSINFSGCTALLQTQTGIQKATGKLPERAYVINYPPNSDRIKPTLIPGGGMLKTNPNPWGVRYKDYVFAEYSIQTETYKRNAPNHNGGNSNIIMDIFTPKNDAEKKRPCLVYIFGGGFYMKVDDCTTEMCKGMVQKGYVVASIDYRIGFANAMTSPQCQGDFNTGFYPAVIRSVQDARSAIRYLKANADRLGIDPDQIFVSGQSAGAITAIGLELYEENDIPQAILSQVGGSLDPMRDNMGYNTKVAGIIPMAGAIMAKELLTKTNKAPFCFITGSCDELIDPYVAPAYKCKEKNTFPDIAGGAFIYDFMSKNNTMRLNLICGGGHGMSSVGFNKLLELVSDFTYSVIEGKPQTGKVIIPASAPVCNNPATCK